MPHGFREICDNAKDFQNIWWLLEDVCGMDLDSFDLILWALREDIGQHPDFDSFVFKNRTALMILDDQAKNYLSNIDNKTIQGLVNDIAPGYHPLMEAVRRDDAEGCRFLLKHGANPNIGTEPWFPLLQADQQRNLTIIELLEKLGADKDRNIDIYNHWSNRPYTPILI